MIHQLSLYVRLSILSTCATLGAQQAEPVATNYVLGPDDQITVQAPDVEEISGKTFRIDRSGHVNLTLIGVVQAAGLTAVELQSRIKDRLRKYLRNPDITVSITDFRSQPVSVVGAVQNSGVHQLQGSKNLLGVLSLAGGLRADAGATVKITRRLTWGRLPLPDAADDPTGQYSVASLPIRSMMIAAHPAERTIRRGRIAAAEVGAR
jgi:polysaccharide export outer membrane protein